MPRSHRRVRRPARSSFSRRIRPPRGVTRDRRVRRHRGGPEPTKLRGPPRARPVCARPSARGSGSGPAGSFPRCRGTEGQAGLRRADPGERPVLPSSPGSRAPIGKYRDAKIPQWQTGRGRGPPSDSQSRFESKASGDTSRNRSVGVELGRGRTLPEILQSMRMVAEGCWHHSRRGRIGSRRASRDAHHRADVRRAVRAEAPARRHPRTHAPQAQRRVAADTRGRSPRFAASAPR